METKKAKDTSRRFRLVEWREYRHASGLARPWVPNFNPDRKSNLTDREAFQFIRKKWVYVFWTTKSFSRLFLEFWVDTDINNVISMTPIDPTKYNLDRDKRPAANPADTLSDLQWPHAINGQAVYYHAFVSRIRLTNAAIQKLHDWIQDKPGYALRKDEEFLSYNGAWHLPVIDPFTIAINLNHRFQQSRDDLLNYTTVYDGQPSRTQERVQQRLKRKVLAEGIKAIVESSDEVKDAIGDDFSSRGFSQLYDVLLDHQKQVNRKVRAINRAASPLCLWLRSEWMEITEALYRVEEEEDMPRFLAYYDASVERITESGPGKAFAAWLLNEAAGNPNHLIQQYAFKDKAATSTEFKVIQKAAGSCLGIFKSLVGVYIKQHDTAAARRLTKSLEYLLGGTVAVGKTLKSFVLRQSSGSLFRRFQVEFLFVEITPGSIHSSIVALEGSKILDRLGGLVSIINYGISLSTIKETARKNGLPLYRDAFGYVASTVSTVNTVAGLLTTSEIAEQAIKRVGVVTALFDTILSVWDADAAARRGDYDRMAGFLLAATGSFASALGGVLVIAGVSSLGTPLAIFGAIAALVGGVISIVAADSELELFISHSEFGSKYLDSGYGGSWAIENYEHWDLDTQLKVMRNLLSAFSIEGDYRSPFNLKMVVGQLKETSVIHTKWTYRRHRTSSLISAPVIKQRISTRPGIVRVGSDKRPFIRVPLPEGGLSGLYDECRVSVWLDYDGSFQVPPLGRVNITLFEDGWYADSGDLEISSKDF